MAIAEITIIPLGTKTPSVSEYVAKAIKVLEEENLKYEITPMGTVVEGELEEIMRLAQRMHESVFDMGVQRVVTTVKIDDRRDKSSDMARKVKSVEEKLDRDR